MSHHNNSTHGMPFMPSFTGGDWPYSEQGRTILPQFNIVLQAPESPANDFQSALRAAQLSASVLYDSPHLQQQTQAPWPSYFLHEQFPEANSPMHGNSDNSPPLSISSAELQRPPPLDVSGGGSLQVPPYFPSYADSQIRSASSGSCSPLSMHSLASSLPCQSPASLTYSAEHCPSAAANTHFQQSMEMFNASLVRSIPSSRGTSQLPYTRIPTPPPPVHYNARPETPEPPVITKKRKRKDARQLRELNRVYARTEYPSTERRRQLASDLDLSARCVQVWFQNERQKNRGRRNRANPANIPHIVSHPHGSPAPLSPMGELSCPSRSPLPDSMRFAQSPSPSSDSPSADIDPCRHRPGPSRGY